MSKNKFRDSPFERDLYEDPYHEEDSNPFDGIEPTKRDGPFEYSVEINPFTGKIGVISNDPDLDLNKNPFEDN